MLDHIAFGAGDLPASTAFYEQALKPLGIELLIEREGALSAFGAGRMPGFLLHGDRPAPEAPLHIAFSASDHAGVDAFHAAALAAGGTDNGAPGPRDYHPNYYGAFVLDPDGNNIEAVCHSAP
jgi:catechol 2,3-dioxygenase-like lactoylglutathione lyase family enzyme